MKRSTRRAGIIASVALISIAMTGCISSGPSPDNSYEFDAGDCTPVIAAVSPEKMNLFTELASLFNDSDQMKNLDRCARVFPVDVSSGEAARLLKLDDAWPEAETPKPRPVIWSPASTIWTSEVAADAGEALVADPKSFARTPVVFAMPELMAKTLGWPEQNIGLKDLHDLCLNPNGWGEFGKAEALWGSFQLGKTNPNTSTTGLNTLLMQSYAASGKTEGLTEADILAAESFSREFESCVIHYGDTTGNVLQRVYDQSQAGKSLGYVSAIAVEETSVINYNLGNPKSMAKPDDGEEFVPPAEGERLIAIYPEEGSLVSDNPLVTLGGPQAPWVSAEQATAAAAFIEFALTDTAQAVLDDFGFRPANPKTPVAGLFSEKNGVNAAYPTIQLEQPNVTATTAAKQQWESIRKPSSVLELIDVSGSMDEPTSDNSTRMKDAISSAQNTLDHFRPTDELGVWAFTTGVSSDVGKNVVEIHSVSPLAGQRESLSNEIGKLVPIDGTPLYDAVLTAYEYMSARAEPGRINAIILLSDGQDEDSETTLDTLLTKLRAKTEGGAESAVRIFPIVYGSGAPPDALTAIAEASGGQVFDASDPRRINIVFRQVVNNF